MATRVFPSQNDVGGSGHGRQATEANMAAWLMSHRPNVTHYADGDTVGAGNCGGNSFGFDLSAHSGLTATIAGGTATVRGHRVEITTDSSVVLTASSHNHLYLRLTKTTGLVSSAEIVSVATSSRDDLTAPDDSIYLWDLITDGSTCTAALDFRLYAGSCVGTYDGNGAAGREIAIGFRPSFVACYGRGVGSLPAIYSMSPIAHAREGTGQQHAGRGPVYMQSADGVKSGVKLASDIALIPQPSANGFTVSGDSPGSVLSWQVLKATQSITIAGDDTEHVVLVDVPGALVGDAVQVGFIADSPASEDPYIPASPQSWSWQNAYGSTSTGMFRAPQVTADGEVWLRGMGSGTAEDIPGVLTVTVTQQLDLQGSLNTDTEEYFFAAYS